MPRGKGSSRAVQVLFLLYLLAHSRIGQMTGGGLARDTCMFNSYTLPESYTVPPGM